MAPRGGVRPPSWGNLQRWTSLPVYYQVVYFTVGTPVYASRDLSVSLSLSPPCPSLSFLRPFPFDVSPATDACEFNLLLSLLRISLSPRLSVSLFPRYTYRNVPDDVGPFAVLSMTRNGLPRFPPTSSSAFRSDRILDGFSSSLRTALLVALPLLSLHAERTVHIVANCVLASVPYTRIGETTDGIISEHCCLDGYPTVRSASANR